MMKEWLLILTVFLLVGTFYSVETAAQSNKINFTFEVDGKPRREKFKVSFVVGSNEYKARATRDAFWIPGEVGQSETMSVRFRSKKYSMEFDVYSKDLVSEWIIGIDNRPFGNDKFGTAEKPYADACLLHYIAFLRGGSILINNLQKGDPNCENIPTQK